jgi:hypothetical protein
MIDYSYTPLVIDTVLEDIVGEFDLDETGGMTAAIIEFTDTDTDPDGSVTANYVLVLSFTCLINGIIYPSQTLIVAVADAVEPDTYQVGSNDGNLCRVLTVTFIENSDGELSTDPNSAGGDKLGSMNFFYGFLCWAFYLLS